MRIANRDSRRYVERLEAFKANHLWAVKENGWYVVYSYGTHWPLWVHDGNAWYENKERYSVTTGKHKSQSRPTLETIKRTTMELHNMISDRGIYER